MTTEQIATKLLEIADFLKSQNDPAEPEPAFTLPPCAPGMEWHRPDGWQPEDLPQGWRPLVLKEPIQKGDEAWQREGWWSTWDQASNFEPVTRHRTRRPLIFTHEGKQWTWHKPGDPMPCDGKREVEVILASGNPTCPKPSYSWCWNERGFDSIIGWRYADEKKTVPLGPEDVPPGSVFRPIGWASMPNAHFNYEAVVINGVRTIGKDWSDFCSEHGYLPWQELKNDWQINRSIPLTGKWDQDAWQPCSKEVEA